jgi:uncharacterized coiled-coil DUF342 family protein
MADDIVTRLRLFNYPLEREAADEIERLRAELAKVRAERDEARREVCEMLERDAGFSAQRQAASRGWGCFKEPAHAP